MKHLFAASLAALALVGTGAMAIANASGEPTRSPQEPKGNIYCVAPSHAGLINDSYAFYGKIDLATGNVEQLHTGAHFTNGVDYDSQSGVLRDDILYIPQYSQDMITAEVTTYWKRFNVKTGERLPSLNFGSNPYAYCYALTYDPSEDRFYGLSLNVASFTMGNLVVIDPETWDIQPVMDGGIAVNVGGAQGDFMGYITYSPIDGMLYGVKDTGEMYSIDKTNGDMTMVYQFDPSHEAGAIPPYGLTTHMCYSPLDRAFITIWRDASIQQMRIVYIDADNYEVTVGKSLTPTTYCAALICTDKYAEPKAPALTEIKNVVFDKASLTGSIEFTAPATLFDGSAAPAQFDVVAELDGKEIYTGKLAPGASHTLSVTTTEGNHNFEVYCKDGSLVGPSDEKTFYVGNDTPLAPENLKIEDMLLSWDAVGGVGVNDGYVDAAAITYDVYLNEEKANAQPLKDTKFSLPQDKEYARYSITVTATSNGKTSAPSKAVSSAFGKGLGLPLVIQPTVEDYGLLTIIDANRDGNGFNLLKSDDEFWVGLQLFYVEDDPDDWAILPALEFDSADHLYSFSFRLANIYATETHVNDIEIFIGTKPEPAEMTRLIYSHEERTIPEPFEISFPFAVPEAGTYYIGIHTKGKGNNYRGVRFNNISVLSLPKRSSAVPAVLEDVKFEAAAKGALATTLTAKMPTMDMAGKPLPADEKISVTATCGTNSSEETALPGQEIEMVVDTEYDGFSDINVILSNSKGDNAPVLYKTYTGIDTPLAPTITSVVPSADNMSATVKYELSEVGEHGGYVDRSMVRFIIANKYSITYTKVGETDELSYLFTVSTPTPTIYEISVAAYNGMGTSRYATALPEQLGEPYEIPLIESFGSQSFDTKPWRYTVEGDYINFAWTSMSDIFDLGLGTGKGELNGGALVCINDNGRPGQGELPIPKVSTKDAHDVLFCVSYWDYPECPKMEVWARSCDDVELKKIADFEPKRTNGSMENAIVQLPEEYQDKNWVQLRIRAIFDGKAEKEYYCIDDIKVYQDVSYDLKVGEITGPAQAMVGETPQFCATLINSGLEIYRGAIMVELMGDGQRLAMIQSDDVRLAPGKYFQKYVSFLLSPEFMGRENYEIRCTAVSSKDEVARNDVRSMPFRILKPAEPYITDLAAKYTDDGTGVELTWSEPDLSYGNYESFETDDAFQITEQIGQWKNVDKDGQNLFAINGLRWDDDTAPTAWVVFDAKKMSVMEDERLRPVSGTKYVMARAVAFDEYTEMPEQNSDWLISPEVIGGTEVSFWFGTISSQYTETIRVYVSSTGENVEDFTRLRNFSKSGEESWELCTFKLPENAKYFAFEYASHGRFGAMIDDIEFTPAKLRQWEIDHYRILRHDNFDWSTLKCVGDDLTQTSFIDPVTDIIADYEVVTYVKRDGKIFQGPRSNMAGVRDSGVEAVGDEGDVMIASERGAIIINGPEGAIADIYDAQGRFISHIVMNGTEQRQSVATGIYIVKTARTGFKILVP